MSKYKLAFSILDETEIIDLVEDYGYTEEEAKEIIQDDKKQENLYVEWLNSNITQSYWVVEGEE